MTHEKPMKKILVVYFSRTGYTRRVAEALAARCDADVEEIREPRARSGVWGYLRSAREAMGKHIVEIEAPVKRVEDYDLVVLGTPVWAGNVASPVRAYVSAQKPHLGRVAFFCTQGGSGAEKVLRALAELCGKEPVATLVVNDRTIDDRSYTERLAELVVAIAHEARERTPV
jgi:flavodoxin